VLRTQVDIAAFLGLTAAPVIPTFINQSNSLDSMYSRLENEWHARYERWAESHAADHLVAGWSERGLSRRLALVSHCIAQAGLLPGSSLLDLGAGPGAFTRRLKGHGFSCIGLDYSSKVLAIAKSKDKSVSYVQGEAYHLPFQRSRFMGVICIGVMQSLENVHLAIEEMRRVIETGGFLFLDGLNSLFWLHSLKTGKDRFFNTASRLNYHNPFYLIDELQTLGFGRTHLYWLAMPEKAQRYVEIPLLSSLPIHSRLFGYAFLISTQKLSC
jgi:2-polyprenyl-3-methyl-5-hydroxy-6-metoxy-1,4-benzoquinol methylase